METPIELKPDSLAIRDIEFSAARDTPGTATAWLDSAFGRAIGSMALITAVMGESGLE